MKKDELRVPDYLAHILQAIERIGTYTDDMDESDFSGANHVVIQHEGYEPFRYATFNYDHRYSSNNSVSMHAENLAKSLGAEEPIERKFLTLIVKK